MAEQQQVAGLMSQTCDSKEKALFTAASILCEKPAVVNGDTELSDSGGAREMCVKGEAEPLKTSLGHQLLCHSFHKGLKHPNKMRQHEVCLRL